MFGVEKMTGVPRVNKFRCSSVVRERERERELYGSGFLRIIVRLNFWTVYV